MIDLQSFKDKVKDFLCFLEIEKNVSDNTLRAYQGDLEQVIDFWEGIAAKEPQTQHNFDAIIKRYIVSLYYKKISKTSLARKFSSLRSLGNYLKTQGITLSCAIKSPRLDKKLPVTLTVDEIFYLLDSVKIEELPSKYPYRDKAIFELTYATGVRCSELISIKLSDINFNERSIKIYGKGRRERIVLFGSKAEEAINHYLENERALMLKNQVSDYLFLNYNSMPLTARSIQRIFEMFRKFLKLDRILTPHKIRHSFATHLLNQGVSLRIIQELLGHKTLATTEIYTHVTNQQLAQMCDEKHPLNNLDHLVKDK